MPAQCVAATGDDAGATFKTAVMLDVNQAIRAERINARWTDEGAELDRAFRPANVMIDFDVALRVNLVRIDAEFGFDVNGHCNLFLSANHANLCECFLSNAQAQRSRPTGRAQDAPPNKFGV